MGSIALSPLRASLCRLLPLEASLLGWLLASVIFATIFMPAVSAETYLRDIQTGETLQIPVWVYPGELIEIEVDQLGPDVALSLQYKDGDEEIAFIDGPFGGFCTESMLWINTGDETQKLELNIQHGGGPSGQIRVHIESRAQNRVDTVRSLAFKLYSHT